MPHWRIKAAIQGAESLLPWSHRWNMVFQSCVTGSLTLNDEQFIGKLDKCHRHLENFWGADWAPTESLKVLELGTGWFPIVPLGMYLCGADEVWTYDRTPLARMPYVRQVLDKYLEHYELGRLHELLPDLQEDRVRELASHVRDGGDTGRSVVDLLAGLNVHVCVQDLAESALPDGSMTLLISNNTLEHIPLHGLTEIFGAFHRLGHPRCVMSHHIDLADHYSYFDKRIGPCNFLQYSDAAWRWYNNRVHYQNRLQISDYRRLHQACGFELLGERNTVARESALEGLKLHPDFASYDRDELLITDSWMISRPSPTAEVAQVQADRS